MRAAFDAVGVGIPSVSGTFNAIHPDADLRAAQIRSAVRLIGLVPALGADVLTLLRPQLYETSFLGMGVMAGPDLMGFLAASRGNPRGLLHATRRVTRHLYDLVTRRRSMQLVNGTALVGRLLRAALDAGVEVRVRTPVTELVRDGEGRVTGVVATSCIKRGSSPCVKGAGSS